jgi:hypothetical protein
VGAVCVDDVVDVNEHSLDGLKLNKPLWINTKENASVID